MEKNVNVNVDINVAKKMLSVAGYWDFVKIATDDEIFEKVLSMITTYGATCTIIE